MEQKSWIQSKDGSLCDLDREGGDTGASSCVCPEESCYIIAADPLLFSSYLQCSISGTR